MDAGWNGEKIRKLRRQMGWSQAELARQLGCRQQTVSEWETNVYLPQNAYSQLLERISCEAEFLGDKVRAVAQSEAIMVERNMAQIELAEVNSAQAEETEPSFDLGID